MANHTQPGEDIAAADQLSQQGLDLLAEGNPSAAVDFFHRAIDRSNACSEAHHGLIRALLDADRPGEAVQAASRLIALAPADPLAQTSLSIALQKSGRIPEAEAAAGRARILEWKQQLETGQPPA